MISRIHSTTIFVSDQDRALDFYVDTLGFEKRADNPYGNGGRWLTVAPEGADTELVLALPKDHGLSGDAAFPRADSTISLVSRDIEATYRTLKGRGVEFRQPPEAMPWGTKATWFTDSDGNAFFLSEE